MFERILFPTDGSAGAEDVFGHVLDLAATYGSTVHVLYVADTSRDSVVQMSGEIVDVLEEEGERIVEAAAERANDRRIDTVTEVRQGDPHRTIVDYAAATDIDLVVMPTQGRRGLARFLLGSTTERVVRQSPVPVLTIRPGDETAIAYPYQEVLVPTDGSDAATAALSVAADVAREEEARLHLLSVIDVMSLGVDVRTDIQQRELREGANKILDEGASDAADAGVDSVVKQVNTGGSIPAVIRSYIEEAGIDLVVVGSHGRTGFDRYVLGSVTESLIRTAPVPVLTVKAPSDT